MAGKTATPGVPGYEGELIGEIEGLQVYALRMEPKRSGKRRLWIQIRQGDEKAWKTSATLSYVNAVDIRFERAQEFK